MTTFWPNFFFKHGKAENVSRVLVLVAGLFTFQVPDVSSDVNSRNIVRNKAEINTRKHSSNGALFVLLYILFNFCPSLFLYFWVVIVFLEFFDFFFLFFDIFSSLRITKEVTTENMSLNK